MRNSCWAAGDRYYINLFWIDVGRVPRVYAPTKYLQRHSVYFIWSRWWNFAFLNLNSSKVAKRFLAEMFSQRFERNFPSKKICWTGFWLQYLINDEFESFLTRGFARVDLHVWICMSNYSLWPDQTRRYKTDKDLPKNRPHLLGAAWGWKWLKVDDIRLLQQFKSGFPLSDIRLL